ncbi:MAG: electron transport complex subunit E [Coriobacteriia bacterium]|nr:electron transport complex subunit E [Actinomycetota bacterium]MDZ4166998.1 electron transport complex subunit E [Coriobacteriia bacterium]
MNEWIRTFRQGIGIENPLTVLMIGLCATLAVSTQVQNALFMGLAVVFVVTMSNILVSVFRNAIPSEVRIPIFIVVIASFVTIVDLVMKAFVPGIYQVLGIWIPLIVVNCMILGRAEAFAYHNKPLLAIADGLGMGIGFWLVMVVLATIRELFGTGAIVWFETTLVRLPAGYAPPSVLLLFPGAFLVFGFMIAGTRWLGERSAARAEARACRR